MASVDLRDDGHAAGVAPPPLPTLHDLFHLDPDQFVGRYPDIAAVNLACAGGLPCADENEFPEYLALLDTIAEAVRCETDRNRRLFKLKPAQFHHSENVFRIYTMEHVFRTRFNIKYDPLVHALVEKGIPWTTPDSREVFIHGILSAKRTGTCSSLPTFAIAVGRRLGYPLKLVLVPNHTLYRWDAEDEVFNLQHTEAGGEVRTDESFHTWPREWTASDFALNERTRVWLHSLTPRQEVSKFLCNRSIMLANLGRFAEALQAVDAAERFNPVNPACWAIRDEVLSRVPASRGCSMTTVWQPIPAGHPTTSEYTTFAGHPGPPIPVVSPVSPLPSVLPMPSVSAPLPLGPMGANVNAAHQGVRFLAAALTSQGPGPTLLGGTACRNVQPSMPHIQNPPSSTEPQR